MDGRRKCPVVGIQRGAAIRLADQRIITGVAYARVVEPIVAIAIVINEGPAVRAGFEIPYARHIEGLDLGGSETYAEFGEAAVREMHGGREGNLFLIDTLVGKHFEGHHFTGGPVALRHDTEPDDVVAGGH